MNVVKLAAVSFVLVGVASLAPVGNANAAAQSTVAAPEPQGSWIAVDDDWLYPLRLESLESLDKAEFHYRRSEEMAAAREVREAASWLGYAATHAQPTTKQKLEAAKTDLRTIAEDLSTGKVVGAERMSSALARASQGLAEWHFYRAREQYGRNEAVRASQDLEAAAAHLQRAANSAHFQFGPDTVTVFNDIIEDGLVTEESRTIGDDRLAERLNVIENAVKELADALA